jgi:hypothetical protein
MHTWQHSQEVAICFPSGAVSVKLAETVTSVSLVDSIPSTKSVSSVISVGSAQFKEPAFSVCLVASGSLLGMLYLLNCSFIF